MFLTEDKHVTFHNWCNKTIRWDNAAPIVEPCKVSKFDHGYQLILSVLKFIKLGWNQLGLFKVKKKNKDTNN